MGCLGSKQDPVDAYSPDDVDAKTGRRASNRPQRESNRPLRDSTDNVSDKGGSKRNSTHMLAKRNSTHMLDKRNSTQMLPGDGQLPQGDVVLPGSSPAKDAPPKKSEKMPEVKRRKSMGESQFNGCEMLVVNTLVAPFSQVEVKWKLKGVKTNEADWIGMYEGVDIPDDIDNYASSMMNQRGKAQGSVKFTAPNHPGLHHFRYFMLDDTEVCCSDAFTITKLDKTEAEEDIHVRDAVLAENEVLRIEGKQVDDFEDEEEIIHDETGVERRVRKKKPEQPKEFDDVTGFEVDENSGVGQAEQLEKWKEEAQRAQEEKTENVMHEATHYVKKIPTKKEMRQMDAKKVEEAQAGGAPGEPKKSGWGKVRGAVKSTAAFAQGRANKQEDAFKKKKPTDLKKKPVGDDMGSFTINRKK